MECDSPVLLSVGVHVPALEHSRVALPGPYLRADRDDRRVSRRELPWLDGHHKVVSSAHQHPLVARLVEVDLESILPRHRSGARHPVGSVKVVRRFALRVCVHAVVCRIERRPEALGPKNGTLTDLRVAKGVVRSHDEGEWDPGHQGGAVEGVLRPLRRRGPTWDHGEVVFGRRDATGLAQVDPTGRKLDPVVAQFLCQDVRLVVARRDLCQGGLLHGRYRGNLQPAVGLRGVQNVHSRGVHQLKVHRKGDPRGGLRGGEGLQRGPCGRGDDRGCIVDLPGLLVHLDLQVLDRDCSQLHLHSDGIVLCVSWGSVHDDEVPTELSSHHA